MTSYQSNQYSVPANYQRKTHLATSIGITTAKNAQVHISLNVMIYIKILNVQTQSLAFLENLIELKIILIKRMSNFVQT